MTAGASGAITPAVFSQFGGSESAAKTGFVAGFKQNYIDDATQEGVVVTVLEFKSAGAAQSYLKRTEYQTLSYAGATYKPFTQVPGAVEADGTRQYSGEYAHCVVAATNQYYYQVVYAATQPSGVPIEFYTWAKTQWALLQPAFPGLPTSPSSTTKAG
jgi:hypothetical protein